MCVYLIYRVCLYYIYNMYIHICIRYIYISTHLYIYKYIQSIDINHNSVCMQACMHSMMRYVNEDTEEKNVNIKYIYIYTNVFIYINEYVYIYIYIYLFICKHYKHYKEMQQRVNIKIIQTTHCAFAGQYKIICI